jgi:hypothetical protein
MDYLSYEEIIEKHNFKEEQIIEIFKYIFQEGYNRGGTVEGSIFLEYFLEEIDGKYYYINSIRGEENE